LWLLKFNKYIECFSSGSRLLNQLAHWIPGDLYLFVFGVLLLVPAQSHATTSDQLAYQLATRYTPYADWASVLDLVAIAERSERSAEAWWTSPEAMRESRDANDLPLSGLHLALDAGHIGGDWAQLEARNFRISESDYWVREGELVLEVAQRVRSALRRAGAEVTLVRESCQPINPKIFVDYWKVAAAGIPAPTELKLRAQVDYVLAVRNRAQHLAIVSGELAERARVVNQEICPDALISLHINAAPWPAGESLQLVDSDHAHVLIFGCLSDSELSVPRQQAQLIRKMSNGSGAIERVFGAALGSALEEVTELPASDYHGRNAIRLEPTVPYLWARNLMLLRLVDCPSVLLEPYIANGKNSYARIQEALRARHYHEPLPADDILLEYAAAVVAGVQRAYGGHGDSH
jgi:N-acetylmuramoyl-L-alanine amidase